MELTGIFREATFSPFQHAENDRLILELTAAALLRRGHRVRLLGEEQLSAARPPALAPVVFSMCQGPDGNARLAAEERQGQLIINSPRGVKACYRVNLVRAARRGTLLPPTRLLGTDGAELQPPPFDGVRSYWLKRGDVHATQAGDVVRVSSPEEYAGAVRAFRDRGIRTAALQQHVEGVVVKFYGVLGSSFFRYYAEEEFKIRPARFGAARPLIEGLVRSLGLEVYGGDAVIDEEGRIYVIDVNDWPSFAYFRREAAEAIASHVHQRAVAFLSMALDRPRAATSQL